LASIKCWGGGKSTTKLTEKLAKNLEQAKKFPKLVPAGKDNRADMLHEARFLPGPTCKQTDIWLAARRHVGLTGVEPVSKFDSEGLGLSGRLNSVIWALLHNPGSKELSIEMLAPGALEAARGHSEKDTGHPKRRFESFHDIRMAMATLRVASRLALPWNLAPEALDFFLNSIQFGEQELGFRPAKFQFLSDFIDQVLHHNAENWDDEKPFMTYGDIRGKWFGDIQEKFPRGGGGPALFTRQEQKPRATAKQFNPPPTKGVQGEPPPTQGTSRAPPYKGPFVPDHLCRRFQFKKCTQQDEKECTPPWGHGKLAHLCSFYNREERKFCEQSHPFVDHK
jgi:hypothetical protein